MKHAKNLAAAAAALLLSTGLCRAAVFDFDFTPTAGSITASGTLTTDSLAEFATIVGISGTVNGVAIQGLVPGINTLHTTEFSTLFGFTDANNVGYEIVSFFAPAALAYSDADSDPVNGTLAITPENLSAVPIPTSFPMFGAALFALGGLGYGLRRRKASAT